MEQTFGINAMAKCLFNRYNCRCNLSKAECQEIPKFLCDCMIEALAKNRKVRLERLGVLSLKNIASRNTRNPATGEELVSTSKKGLKFKASRYACKRVNNVKIPRRRAIKLVTVD